MGGDDADVADAAEKAESTTESMNGMNAADSNDVRALKKGIKARKMPRSRRGSIHKTSLRLTTVNEKQAIVYDSRNKWEGDIMIPVSDAVVREGPVTENFNKLGSSKNKVSQRAMSIQGPNGREIDVVFRDVDEYERTVRAIHALQVAEKRAEEEQQQAAMVA